MRDFKFRVWDKLHEEWLQLGEDYFIVYEGEKLEVVQGDECWAEELKEVEVMQYTGLKDMKGREIYEGDIITYHLNKSTLGIVKYGEYAFHTGFYVSWEGGLHPDLLRRDLAFWCGKSEVIGNVYEQPELLKS